ncbi:hypothetical protein Syun_014273 [Stephania yunnanensis]|uniref:Uncharacterized protein n=1 Tax=Stephania yunnanensis TaxID=152371 RepID=A0AAP0JKP7_9MAGN
MVITQRSSSVDEASMKFPRAFAILIPSTIPASENRLIIVPHAPLTISAYSSYSPLNTYSGRIKSAPPQTPFFKASLRPSSTDGSIYEVPALIAEDRVRLGLNDEIRLGVALI